MVLPGRSAGQLQIVDVSPNGKLDVQIVPAHSSSLRALELSPDEEIVASASDKVCLARHIHLMTRIGRRIIMILTTKGHTHPHPLNPNQRPPR